MSRPVPRHPHCVGCSRPVEETLGMVSVRAGGMPTYLCFDCVDELKMVADRQREAARMEAADD